MTLTNDSVAVITGAGSGIGRALAVTFAKAGILALAIADKNEQGLIETKSLIGRSDKRISLHVVDVADLMKMREFVQDVISKYGRVTHLVNNAGVSLIGGVEEVSIEDIQWLMNINFWGMVYGVKLFLPILLKQPVAHIINISSVFGLIAPPGNAAYSASKFAMRGFTESLSNELRKTNVAVSCVHPGGVLTNIVKNGKLGVNSDGQLKDQAVHLHASVSRTTAEEAAEIILRGIRRKSRRILIGTDARFIDVIQRMSPVNYFSFMNWLSGRKLEKVTGRR